MSELNLLDKKYQFQGRDIKYCELCQTFYIVCEECTFGSCTGCCACTKTKEFHKLKSSPLDYLDKHERDIIVKHNFIKKHLPRFLAEGKEFDLSTLQEEGHTSKVIDDIFSYPSNSMDLSSKW